MNANQTNASIAIRRLNAIATVDAADPAGIGTVAAFAANMLALGYALNADAFAAASKASAAQLADILAAARQLKGDATYKPMYPNFPQQVADASDAELYVNAMLHYFGDWLGVRILPDYVKAERPELSERLDIVVLGAATDADFTALARQLVEQGQPFSEQDTSDLTALSAHVTGGVTGIKENAATLAIMFPDIDWSASFKTIVDVLRLAVAYSGGDVSLAAATRFRLTRGQRRTILSMLDAILSRSLDAAEDFSRHTEQWKRLAKALHHGEYASRYPLASEQLSLLQSGDAPATFNARVEAAILAGDYDELMRLVSARPGVLARRLFEIITKFPTRRTATVAAFAKVASGVSIPVLVQLHNHFSSPRADELPQRVIRTKAHPVGLVVDNRLRGDYTDVLDAVHAGLAGRKSELRVRMDLEKAAQFAVPLAIRSASTGLRQIGRGSRVKIAGDKGTIRLFMHWRDIQDDGYRSRVDLDLSVVFASEDFSQLRQVSYTNLRDRGIRCVHSGDITSAPHGAAEFVDVDIDSALAAGMRYVLPTVYSYTGQKLNLVPEAWAGVMLRSEPSSGEIFEPATVAERFDLTVQSVNATPFAFDLATRELIWLDSAVSASRYAHHNVHSNADALVTTLKAAVLTRPMNVAQLTQLVATVCDDEDAVQINPDQTAEVLQLIA
jgi:hypothetical protein